ncbi:hypothetical protein EVAR_47469_1 [Eumeta japonica]|uniref:Uncharacterized protein n=1 Tax=Eumeta variegata TaxID=151549 RepID=A0A4C1XA88_EUMVA|nr:hypothetical protein EVAR_47469_1 [Eumeta japonica]
MTATIKEGNGCAHYPVLTHWRANSVPEGAELHTNTQVKLIKACKTFFLARTGVEPTTGESEKLTSQKKCALDRSANERPKASKRPPIGAAESGLRVGRRGATGLLH